MDTLTIEQLKKAKELDSIIDGLHHLKEKLGQYQLNSVYIFEHLWPGAEPEVSKGHMGFPKKYKVVHISKMGIPFLRQLSAVGNPVGDAFIPPEAVSVRALEMVSEKETKLMNQPVNGRFVADPGQLDAILLQEQFDPMEAHREKSKLFNEINKHNKRVAVETGNNYQSISNFFKRLQPGDKFWTSVEKQYVIQSVVKVNREYVITCTDINQATVEFRFSNFMYKRLYSEQPRSFHKETRSE
jgi:hypothetical protein